MLKGFFLKDVVEAGCDEAGRGCLAGPVFAAAVILPKNFRHPLLNDSKQMTKDAREELRVIIEKKAVAWAVGVVDNLEIDIINIYHASHLAMHRALDQLSITPDHLIIDGNRFTPYRKLPHTCIVEGDGKYKSIAAASVLAKTHRDEYMRNLHIENDVYGWDSNKGYGTKVHRKAIEKHGISIHHRKSFRLFDEQFDAELEEA